MRVKDKISLVTGAAQGIGKAIALKLAEEGSNVVLVDVNKEKCEEVSKEIQTKNRKSWVYKVDVSDFKQVEELFGNEIEKWGRIDILVNNAGIMRFGMLHETPIEEWESMMNTNVFGPWRLMVHAVPYMRKVGGGSIINLSSIAGIKAFPGSGIYCTSKSALQTISQVMSMETAADNIRVNLILPALVEDTELAIPIFGKENIPDFYNRLRNLHPLGRNGKPKDIADAALFFASVESSWITGVMLSVDGGRHLTTNRPANI